MQTILIVGHGYSGSRLAALHRARGDAVIATSRRTPADAAGLRFLPLDLDQEAGFPPLPRAHRVYYTAPPPDQGRTDIRLARLLEALPPPGTFIYFSTTGVYGDRGGAVVDEDTPAQPSSDRARRRLDAESLANAWCRQNGLPCGVLRIAGIYGPGRLPLERLRAGMPVAEGNSPGNRIHVDDLVAAALAVADAIGNGHPAATWNVTDGNPLPTADFHDLVADAAGLPPPRRVPADSPELTAGMRSFLADSRRVDNRRLLSLPGFRLRYPDPIDGVRQSITR